MDNIQTYDVDTAGIHPGPILNLLYSHFALPWEGL